MRTIRGKGTIIVCVATYVAAAVSLAIFVFRVATVLPHRVPATGVECQYIVSCLDVWDFLRVSPSGLADVLINGHFVLGNCCLIADMFAIPFLAFHSSYTSFYLSSVCLTILACLFALVAVKRVVGYDRGRDSGSQARCTCDGRNGPANISTVIFAVTCTGLIMLLSPITLVSACFFNANASCVFVLTGLLLLYVIARRVWTNARLAAFSLTISLSLLVKPQWSITLVVAMFAMYVVDEFKLRGWRDGVAAVVTGLGLAAVAALWNPAHVVFQDPVSESGICFFASVCVAVLLLFAWMLQGPAAGRRAFLYGAPAVLVLLVWLSARQNGADLLAVIQNYHSGPSVPFLQSYAWKVIRYMYSGSLVGACVRASLFLLGIAYSIRRWPGIIALLAVHLLQLAWMIMPQALALYIVYILVVLISGFGCVELVRWLQRTSFGHQNFRRLGERVVLSVLASCIAILLAYGVSARIETCFEQRTGVEYPLFDRDRPLRALVELIESNLPPQTTCAVMPETPSFSRLSLECLSRMKGLGWQVRSWPDLARPSRHGLPRYLVVVRPGTNGRRYFSGIPSLDFYFAITNMVGRSQEWVKKLDEAQVSDRFLVDIYGLGTL